MRISPTIAVLFVALTITVAAQSIPTTKGNIVGTWVKDHMQQEGGVYPGDTNWQLEVTFSSDGSFVWQSIRTERDTTAAGVQARTIDESVKGKYVKEGYSITYQFDRPSEDMLRQLPQFFAFWPRQLRGQQTFSFRDRFLRLGNDGGKTWVFLRRKETRRVDPPSGN